jgi:hypothetical protein
VTNPMTRRLRDALCFIGRGQAPHSLLLRSFVRLFARELRGDHVADLEQRLAEGGEEDQQVLAAMAAVAQALEVGKTAVSSKEWLESSCMAELVLARMSHKVGSKVVEGLLDGAGARADEEEASRAAAGLRRKFRVCSLLKGELVGRALREGGVMVRDSASRGDWGLFRAEVGMAAEPALMAFGVMARLLGSFFIRFELEARCFPLQIFFLLLEAYDCEEPFNYCLSKL